MGKQARSAGAACPTALAHGPISRTDAVQT